MYFKFAKVRNVKNPSRAHLTDAGMDFFIPQFNEKFIEDLKSKNPLLNINGIFLHDDIIEIHPQYSILIPSGIVTEIGYGYMGLFLNKSGIAAKYKLLIGAQVIDTAYSGEVHINLHNVGSEPIKLESGQKVVQMILVPTISATPKEVDISEIYKEMNSDSNRGAGGFGSSGK